MPVERYVCEVFFIVCTLVGLPLGRMIARFFFILGIKKKRSRT